MYGHEKSKSILKKLKDIIKSLFSQYMSLNPLPLDTHASSGLSLDVASQSQVESNDDGSNANLLDKFKLKVKKMQGELKRIELDRYMEDDVEDNYEGFDVLRWWRGKIVKYHVLSYMAKYILAIPVFTISSKSAFRIGGRVIDPYRSSLSPTTWRP